MALVVVCGPGGGVVAFCAREWGNLVDVNFGAYEEDALDGVCREWEAGGWVGVHVCEEESRESRKIGWLGSVEGPSVESCPEVRYSTEEAICPAKISRI